MLIKALISHLLLYYCYICTVEIQKQRRGGAMFIAPLELDTCKYSENIANHTLFYMKYIKNYG